MEECKMSNLKQIKVSLKPEDYEIIKQKAMKKNISYTTPRKPNNFTENLILKRVKLGDKYRGVKR